MADQTSIGSDDVLTLSLYSFLENLMSVIRTSEIWAAESFSRNQVTGSGDVTPGGYSEDLFIFLSQREKDEYTCSIWTCVQLNDKIGAKRVKCQKEDCNWRGFLRDYNDHGHKRYEFKELTRFIDLPNIRTYNNNGTLPEPRSLLQMSEDCSRSSDLSHMIPRINRSDEIDRRQAAGNRSEDNVDCDRQQQLEYHRLAPTYASRRHNIGFLHSGNARLSTILIYLNTETDEMTTTSSTHTTNVTTTPSVVSTSTGVSDEPSPSAVRTNSRMVELHSLNQRLLEVANSFDSLVGTINVQSESGLVSTGVSGSSSSDDDSSANVGNSNNTE